MLTPFGFLILGATVPVFLGTSGYSFTAVRNAKDIFEIQELALEECLFMTLNLFCRGYHCPCFYLLMCSNVESNSFEMFASAEHASL